MTSMTDSAGRSLPEIECPGDDRLRAYGDMMFLAFRSARHAAMSTALLRTYLEPPLLLGQYRIFRFDGVPRGMFTWGWFGPEAERKIVSGEHLSSEDWNSGARLWIVDLIAPYKGLTRGISRWVMEPGNFTGGEFLFRRVTAENTTRRILHVDFRNEKLARVLSDDDILTA